MVGIKRNSFKSEPFENPDDLFISPSRTYIIAVADAKKFDDKHLCKVVIPEDVTNTPSGAVGYFRAKYGYNMIIDYCEPYEYCNKKVAGIECDGLHSEPYLNGEKDKGNEILVSPSKTYVIFVQDVFASGREHIYKIALPDVLPNNKIEAVSHFLKTYDAAGRILDCFTYEMYAEVVLATTFENPFENSYPAHVAKIHRLMDKGHSKAEIAKIMGISEKMVSIILWSNEIFEKH